MKLSGIIKQQEQSPEPGSVQSEQLLSRDSKTLSWLPLVREEKLEVELDQWAVKGENTYAKPASLRGVATAPISWLPHYVLCLALGPLSAMS